MQVAVDVREYPDAGKVMVVSGNRGSTRLWMFRAENTVDYCDREPK